MKHILLLAVMLVLGFGASATPTETSTARVSGMRTNVVEIEGVEFSGQEALLKTGYQFQREGASSLAVLKTSNVARIQTGTLTCTRLGRRRGSCTVAFSGYRAKCSSSCYFVGYRGGARAQ